MLSLDSQWKVHSGALFDDISLLASIHRKIWTSFFTVEARMAGSCEAVYALRANQRLAFRYVTYDILYRGNTVGQVWHQWYPFM